jgi:PilZ domain
LVNISETGIGFYSDWPLEQGTILILKHSSQAKHLVVLTAKVIHSTKHEKGNWLVGCAFAKRLEPEDLEDLL